MPNNVGQAWGISHAENALEEMMNPDKGKPKSIKGFTGFLGGSLPQLMLQ
jgi:hypothetical protein